MQSNRPRVVHITRPRVVHTGRPRPVQTTRPSLVQYSAVGDTLRADDHIAVTGNVSINHDPSGNAMPVIVLSDWTIVSKGAK